MKSIFKKSEYWNWYENKYNELHNLYGPAGIWKFGSKIKTYHICNKRYDNFIEYIKAVIKYKKSLL